MCGHVEVVNLLLEAGADINVADYTDGIDSLMLASQNGHNEIVKLLLEAGANVNQRNYRGGSPLHMATAGGVLRPSSCCWRPEPM